MKVCIKVTYGDVSEKELLIDVQTWRLFSKYWSYQLLLIRKKYLNCMLVMVSHTPQFKRKNNQKASTDFA